MDLRLAGGVASAGYGIYNVMTGKGGEHALAVGNGLISTALGRVGRNAGKALSEKRDKSKDKGQAKAEQKAEESPADPKAKTDPGAKDKGAGAIEESTQGDFGDLVRDIFLTPDGDATEGRRGGRPERAKPSRFIRATVTR